MAVGFGKGLRLCADPRYEQDYLNGVHESLIQEAILRHLERGGVFYDVGAHIGFFSRVPNLSWKRESQTAFRRAICCLHFIKTSAEFYIPLKLEIPRTFLPAAKRDGQCRNGCASAGSFIWEMPG